MMLLSAFLGLVSVAFYVQGKPYFCFRVAADNPNEAFDCGKNPLERLVATESPVTTDVSENGAEATTTNDLESGGDGQKEGLDEDFHSANERGGNPEINETGDVREPGKVDSEDENNPGDNGDGSTKDGKDVEADPSVDSEKEEGATDSPRSDVVDARK